MGGEGAKTTLILLLIFIRGATNDANDIMENNVTAKSEQRKIARVKKLAPLGKEGRVVKALRENQDGTRREPGRKGALREKQEGCPPRLAEFLV